MPRSPMQFLIKNYRKNTIYTLVILFFFLSPLVPYRTHAQLNEDTIEKIDSYIEDKVMKKYVLAPGTSIGIIYKNETVYVRGYGQAAKDRPTTKSTPFILGSVSKSFTAMAIMQLNESGKLNLDDPIQRHIPWFTTQNDTCAAMLTIRHLLHHLSGFHKERDSSKDISLEELVRTSEGDTHLAAPGSLFYYNNLNYQILGYIVEVVSMQSFSSYIQEYIFNPLNMSNSYLSEEEASTHGLAQGYTLVFGVPLATNYIHPISWNPSSNIISSAEDMTHYMIALMNKGKYGNTSILSPEGTKMLWEKYIHSEDLNYGSYAMGWNNFTIDGMQYIRHIGKAKNYLSEVIMTPEEGWGVVILHNVYGELNQLHPTGIGAWNTMRILLDQPLLLEKLTLVGYYAIVDVVLAIMLFSLAILPQYWLRKKLAKHKEASSAISKKWGLFVMTISLTLALFIFLLLPGLITEALSDHWLWFWNKEIWNVPDLASVFSLICISQFTLGIRLSFVFFKRDE